MKRNILIKEEKSGLAARFELLDEAAPANSDFLWRLAAADTPVEGIHAMWTGPEISCPLAGDRVPSDIGELPLENATMYPEAGDIAVVFAAPGRWKGMPGDAFYDIGLFYDKGGRLLMPFGWISASICARVVADDYEALKEACRQIRRAGACTVTITR